MPWTWPAADLCGGCKPIMKKIISQKYPPTETKYVESQFRHRNGEQVAYVRGLMPLGMGDWEEIGWCPICACEVATYADGQCLQIKSPQFYQIGSNHMNPCPSCKEKCVRVHAIKMEIAKLNSQIRDIAAEIDNTPYKFSPTTNPVETKEQQ